MDLGIPTWAYVSASTLLFALIQRFAAREVERFDDHRKSTDARLDSLRADCSSKDDERRKRLHELADHIGRADVRIATLEERSRSKP